MTKHLQREIQALKREILSLGTAVEEMVYDSLKAVAERDQVLAASVVERDRQIDQSEVRIEEECLKILALHQPVAIDLRFIVAVFKINNDLERIGDLAVNIAKRATNLCQLKAVFSPPDFKTIAEKTKIMLRQSLQSLIELDPKLAREVCAADDEVDRIHSEMFGSIQDGIRQHPEQLESLILYLSVSRNLERIADHATNIAEDVIYMHDGDIVRHGINRK